MAANNTIVSLILTILGFLLARKGGSIGFFQLACIVNHHIRSTCKIALHAHMVIFLMAVLISCKPDRSGARTWEPVAPGMVLTRNFMVPESPTKDGFQLLPKNYRLGSKAYAKAAPEWWLRLASEAGVNEKWHPKDFPLVYSGKFKSKDGGMVLLVVQASQAFTGDGFYSPGPVLYLVARLFSTDGGSSKLLKEQVCSLGDMQYSRLLAGSATERQVVFRTEKGSNFDSREIEWKQDWILSLDDDHSLSFKECDAIKAKK